MEIEYSVLSKNTDRVSIVLRNANWWKICK